MRVIIERFAGRYQIWRDEKRGERRDPTRNPLVPFVVVGAAFVAWDIYKAFVSHQIEWRVVEVGLLFAAFVILCLWRPRWAWIMFLIWGATIVIESPWVYTLQSYRYPARVRLASALFVAGMGVVAFAYGFVIRRRYESYRAFREEEKSRCGDTDASNQATQRTASRSDGC